MSPGCSRSRRCGFIVWAGLGGLPYVDGMPLAARASGYASCVRLATVELLGAALPLSHFFLRLSAPRRRLPQRSSLSPPAKWHLGPRAFHSRSSQQCFVSPQDTREACPLALALAPRPRAAASSPPSQQLPRRRGTHTHVAQPPLSHITKPQRLRLPPPLSPPPSSPDAPQTPPDRTSPHWPFRPYAGSP